MLPGDGPFYTLTLKASAPSSRERGVAQDSRSHPFKEDFFSNFRPLDEFAPQQTGVEFLHDRSVNVFMADNHSREGLSYRRGLMTIYKNPVRAVLANT